MHNAEHGDYGPVIFAIFIVVVSLVALFDIKGFARHLARRVVERSPTHRRLGETFGYWTIRASGVSGMAAAIAISFLL